jgi:hypothetical protein
LSLWLQDSSRKQQSTVRSIAYYRDPVGKKKKRVLNAKRRRHKKDGDRPAACLDSFLSAEAGGRVKTMSILPRAFARKYLAGRPVQEIVGKGR